MLTHYYYVELSLIAESIISMKRFIIYPFFIIAIMFAAGAHAQEMSFEQVLQKVVYHYPSLKSAAIQVERARQASATVESQLGWRLGAQGGVTRDISLFGTPTDIVDVGGSLSRSFESGSSLGLEANVVREDNETILSPTLPNPSTSTSIDLTYRQPLARGSDNPLFTEGMASAEAGVIIARAESAALYDQVASQLIELYMAAATTKARIENNKQAVGRAKRLQKYIKDRTNLGVSEDKDILQANAQLKGLQAESHSLQTLWQQQRISLNRLMGRDWSAEIETTLTKDYDQADKNFDTLFKQAQQHDPALLVIDGRIQLADSAIRTRRDARQDNLDVVLFIGNRTRDGDASSGDVSESEIVGGIRLEFSQDINKSGVDAELYQAQLDRSKALQDKRQAVEDLQYELSSLLAEIKANRKAIDAYEASVASESKKLEDAVKRYRAGRTDTDQLIQFEDQQSRAALSLELQRIELARRYYSLYLRLGKIWQEITLPDHDGFVVNDEKAMQ